MLCLPICQEKKKNQTKPNQTKKKNPTQKNKSNQNKTNTSTFKALFSRWNQNACVVQLKKASFYTPWIVSTVNQRLF